MERLKLEKLIEKGYTHKKLSSELNVAESTIRYWLKKYNLKTKNNKYNNKGKNEEIGEKYCSMCNKTKKIIDFYQRSDRDSTTGYCKVCTKNYHRSRLEKIKIKMIKYKGGECMKCKLKLENSHYSVFDFHHIDPNEKIDNFKGIKHKKWEVIKEEIDKCDLLCANCHRIEHSKR